MKVKRQNKKDLRLHLLALYLLFVIPIFLLVLFFYINASQRLRDDVAAADLSLARAIALETDEMLLNTREMVEAFAHMPAVIRTDAASMRQSFAAGSAARQDINLFYRLSPEGIMLYHYPSNGRSTVGQDFSLRDFFQTARHTQEYVFSNGRVSSTTNQPVVSIAGPVFNKNRFDGVVGANFELQRLVDTVKRIGLKLPHNNGLKIIIVDTAGQVIAHSEPNNLLVNVLDTLPGIQEVLSGREGSLIAKDPWGAEWLYTYSPIPSAGWGVVVQRPTRLAFASLASIQRGLLLAMVLFSLGAFLFWGILSRRVINPLAQLTRYGEKVGQETVEAELDREMILPISQRPDQIGRLTRTLLRAERDIRQRLTELTTLNKTSAAVAASLDTQQVINTILTQVQRLLRVRQCALLVMNEATQQLEFWAYRGLSQNYPAKLDLEETSQKLPAYRAITSGQPVQVPDVEVDSRLAPLLPTARAEGYRSLLIIPFTALHVPPAALAIYRTDPHHFDNQEIDLATSFANQAAIALEHATLFSLTDAELQKRVRFLSGLNKVGRIVSQSLQIVDILNNALEAIVEVMQVDACWIYLQRETEQFLRLRMHHGLPEEMVEPLSRQKLFPGEGIIGQVVEWNQLISLNGQELQPGTWVADPLVTTETWKSLAVAPLAAKGNVIGAVGMATRNGLTFTHTELDLLQAIGDQIAVAIVNSRLYRRNREVAILEERNRMAREIHDTLAQGFTGILVQLQAAERLSLKRPQQAVQSLQEARELARESLQEARRSVLNLRPTGLETQALDQALAQHLKQVKARSKLKTNFEVEGYPRPLDLDVRQHLYRITQEALTNVTRHAKATQVNVTLVFAAKMVILKISDDGIGLNGRNGPTNGRNGGEQLQGGFGLVGIQERVNLMKGEVTFDAPKNGGTCIRVVIPK